MTKGLEPFVPRFVPATKRQRRAGARRLRRMARLVARGDADSWSVRTVFDAPGSAHGSKNPRELGVNVVFRPGVHWRDV